MLAGAHNYRSIGWGVGGGGGWSDSRVTCGCGEFTDGTAKDDKFLFTEEAFEQHTLSTSLLSCLLRPKGQRASSFSKSTLHILDVFALTGPCRPS